MSLDVSKNRLQQLQQRDPARFATLQQQATGTDAAASKAAVAELSQAAQVSTQDVTALVKGFSVASSFAGTAQGSVQRPVPRVDTTVGRTTQHMGGFRDWRPDLSSKIAGDKDAPHAMNAVERAFVDDVMNDRHKMLDLISELPMAMSMSERVDRLSAKQVEGGFELTVFMKDIFVEGRERNAGTFKVGADGKPVDG